MPLKMQPTQGNDNIARSRADILMSHGSYAAAEALMHCAMAHVRKAQFAADTELAEHWEQVRAIFEEAKLKLGALT